MLKEQAGLNFFEIMGHNINNFSKESIMYAVSNNYVNKLLNVICTEDINGYLTMMPANQVQMWAHIEGEIRPSGRNHYNVWTPVALRNFLTQMGAFFDKNLVISGYKITPLFFVYVKNCDDLIDKIRFNISDVQQLNPTVAGKVFFKTLTHNAVKKYYGF